MFQMSSALLFVSSHTYKVCLAGIRLRRLVDPSLMSSLIMSHRATPAASSCRPYPDLDFRSPLSSTPFLPTMSATSSTNELNPVEPVEALDDEGNPFVHTDITEIPALLASEDILTQSEAMQGIMLPGSRLSPNSHTEFDNFPVKDLTLHRLRNDYSTQNARMAMTRLRGRSRLVIQADDKIDPVFPMYGWRNNIHRIDSFTVIPKYFGLTAIIPNVALDHNYSFDFTLSQRHKIWQGKYIDLGFNPKGRMLHIGRAQGQNVWLAMVPAEFWGQVSRSQDYDEDQNESSTIVPTDRYRKICFLMSFLLTRSGIGGVFAEHTYSRNLDAPETNGWHVDTNIL